MLSSAGQPTHPYEVGAHDVVERAMQTFEVRTDVSSILLVWQSARHSVYAHICPRVVVSHHCEVRLHGCFLSRSTLTVRAHTGLRYRRETPGHSGKHFI